MHRLIVPGLFEPPDPGALPGTPLLDHLAGRGDVERESPAGYEELLGAAFGIDAAGADIPTGALLANLRHGRTAAAGWACVAPVHLHVDRDRLLLFPVETARVDAGSVVGALNDYFAQDGVRFHATTQGPWLLELNTPRTVKTCPIDQVAGRSLDPFMPAGEDARWLRGIMNESQMLLHREQLDHSVNSLWFWGFGSLPVVSRRPLEMFSNELISKAFYAAISGDAESGDSSLFVTAQCLEGRHSGDMQRWISGVRETENRLRDLLPLRGEPLLLQSDNGVSLHYRSPMRFRFWQSGNFAGLLQSPEYQG